MKRFNVMDEGESATEVPTWVIIITLILSIGTIYYMAVNWIDWDQDILAECYIFVGCR